MVNADQLNRIEKSNRAFVIFPYGKIGSQVKKLLNDKYKMTEAFCIDNNKEDGKNIFSTNNLPSYYKECLYVMCSYGLGAFSIKKNLMRKGILEENIIDGCPLVEEKIVGIPYDFIGKKAYAAFWEKLFELSILGMNIGEGGSVITSGEENVYDALKKIFDEKLTIFDVGANIGMYADGISKSFPTAVIHCFEPGRVTFSMLKENLFDRSNIIYNNVGVGRTEATLFYDIEGSGIASLYNRNLDYLNIEMNKSERVSIITIDDYCKTNHIDYIHLMKMDIEGNEYNALCGACDMLGGNRIGMIQFEFGGCNIDSHTYFRDFWNILHENYRIYRIMKDGFLHITEYSEYKECFLTTNYLAVNRDITVNL